MTVYGLSDVQDSEEITNIELADAFQQMWAKRRYNEIFFMIDTCQVGPRGRDVSVYCRIIQFAAEFSIVVVLRWLEHVATVTFACLV